MTLDSDKIYTVKNAFRSKEGGISSVSEERLGNTVL